MVASYPFSGLLRLPKSDTFPSPVILNEINPGGLEPDAAARAYLRVIARELNTVRRALAARTKPSP